MAIPEINNSKDGLKSEKSIIDLQQIVVIGTITDASTGNPMPGVNILVKGTTVWTLSEINGKYTLQVSDPKNAVLVFSFIGYRSQEIPVGGRSVEEGLH